MEKSSAILTLIFLLFLGNVDSADDVMVCPTGCRCEFNSHSALRINCHQNIARIDPDQLTRQLDSILSAEHITVRLTSLTITDTPLTHVPASACQLLNLVYLNLSRNHLTSLPDDCLNKLTMLKYFAAANNSIVALQDGLFDGLKRLEVIHLRRNQITDIGLGLFANSSGLNSLRAVHLNHNNLTTLEPWWYYLCVLGNASFKVNVSLDNNRISTFTNEMQIHFECGRKRPFGKLSLHKNPIAHIMDILRGWEIGLVEFACLLNFQGAVQQMTFSLYGSSFACDCVDYPFYKWQRKFPTSKVLDNVRCNTLDFDIGLFQYVQAISVSLDEFVCQVTHQCPSGCRCVYRPENATLHVYCSATNLSSLPLHLPPLPKSYVRYKLDFANNERLRNLEYRPYLVNTSILDVRNCSLGFLDLNIWKMFVAMQSPFVRPKVFLQQNYIESIPAEVTAINFSSVSFSLKNNPWKCSCENRWMVDWFKTLSFATSNGEDVLCASPPDLDGRSILNLDEYDFCTHSGRATLKVTLSCALPAAALLALIVVGYLLRIRLYRRWKFHPFDRDECLGEDVQYDVFLSCSSEDCDPHGRHILTLLESKGYRVCYHVRDFVAGELVTDNMLHSIVRSKRTVCLVSKNFLNSTMCMTEFNIAFNHHVAMHSAKRLIVLMMLDSPNDLYANDASDASALSRRTHQYTYIDYTADDWLDKLLYALPLRGLRHGSQQDSDDVQLLTDIQPPAVNADDKDVPIIN